MKLIIESIQLINKKIITLKIRQFDLKLHNLMISLA